MALFRMTAAFGLLLAVAPDQTLHAARSVLGMAQEAAPAQPASAEAALAFCRSNAELCLDAARRAAGGASAKPGRS